MNNRKFSLESFGLRENLEFFYEIIYLYIWHKKQTLMKNVFLNSTQKISLKKSLFLQHLPIVATNL